MSVFRVFHTYKCRQVMLFGGVTAFSIYKLYSFLSCVWFVERDVSSLGLFKTRSY